MRRVTLIRALVSIIVLTVVGYAGYVFLIKDDDTVPRRNAAVTEANNGGEVTVPPDKPFVLNLRGTPDAPWNLPRAHADTLAMIGSSLELDGSVSVTFVPVEVSPGVQVTAERGGATPERFEVTIRVVR